MSLSYFFHFRSPSNFSFFEGISDWTMDDERETDDAEEDEEVTARRVTASDWCDKGADRDTDL